MSKEPFPRTIPVVGETPQRELLDFLEAHYAHVLLHGRSSLLAHLVGTWRLLRGWKMDDTICNAGLFHSVYGTERYLDRCCDTEERDVVRAQIGVEAEHIAYVFCAMERATFYAAVLCPGEEIFVRGRWDGAHWPLSVREARALAHVLVANFIEQREALHRATAARTVTKLIGLGGLLGHGALRALENTALK